MRARSIPNATLRRLALILALLLAPPAWAQEPVSYECSFENRDHHEASIAVTFSELPSGPLELRMSRSSPGRYALHEFAKNVYAVRATDRQGRPLDVTRPDPHQWNVEPRDGFARVSYTVFGDRTDGTYLSIDSTHAHLNAPATFLWARGLESRPVRVRLRVPEPTWRIATQLTPTADPETFAAPNLGYLLDSPIEVSAFDLREWTVGAPPEEKVFRLALHHRGTPAEADAFARMVEAVVLEQIGVFQELPRFDYGTYTFLADYFPGAEPDGMEHRNSTVLTGPHGLRDDAVRNLGGVSHELFHAWNVERVRPRALEPFDFERANMSGELWFAEGFTSYYGPLVLRRAGILSLDRYAHTLTSAVDTVANGAGRRYFSPVEMSQRAPFVDDARWVDPDNRANIYVSYYPYGAVIALGLDLTLRSRYRGVSLDDFMRAVWEAHGRSELPYGNEDLRDVLSEVTGDSDFAADFFDRYVFGRELPDYETLLAQAGLILRKARPGRAWVGSAPIEHEDGRAVVRGSTVSGSPLYEAGVDREDVLLELGGRRLGDETTLSEALEAHRPGDRVELRYEKDGIERVVSLTFQEDPALEVVPFEHESRPVSAAVAGFRDAWLGGKGGRAVALHRYCPRCDRGFPFEFEHCRYDGAALVVTKERGRQP